MKGVFIMNGTIKKVFLIIGLLVLIFIAWQLVFNEGGILRTGYNSLANGINSQWAKVAGKNQTILALWDKKTADTNNTGFEINTKAK